LLFTYGAKTTFVAEESAERGLSPDGSFFSVVDILPGGEITLWAVTAGDASEPLLLKAAD
jgi:hypothetical protein